MADNRMYLRCLFCGHEQVFAWFNAGGIVTASGAVAGWEVIPDRMDDVNEWFGRHSGYGGSHDGRVWDSLPDAARERDGKWYSLVFEGDA